MKKTPYLFNMSPSEGRKATRREISLFLLCLGVMSILYNTPRLFSTGYSIAYLQELFVDCLIMGLAGIPIWWLHFRQWTRLSLKTRFLLHILTCLLYYISWVTLYQLYNSWLGLPLMNIQQMLQNSGPNFLFYVQVFSLLHLDVFYREKAFQQRREQELREIVHHAEISALKAQIQPHFLFNTLNSISASVPPEQEHTRVLIAKLADTFRYALQSTQHDLVPLSQEIDFIRTYLSLEQARFGNRMTFFLESDAHAQDILIPPMLLQPLVENAVKHAIEPCIEGGTIKIDCISEDKKTMIRIENTGLPYTAPIADLFQGKGVGISNTVKRLESQYGETLRISINPQGGLCIVFTLSANKSKVSL